MTGVNGRIVTNEDGGSDDVRRLTAAFSPHRELCLNENRQEGVGNEIQTKYEEGTGAHG